MTTTVSSASEHLHPPTPSPGPAYASDDPFGTALLFWWVLIKPSGHRRLGHAAGILYVFTAALQSGALGALLTFARTPLYPIYTSSTAGESNGS